MTEQFLAASRSVYGLYGRGLPSFRRFVWGLVCFRWISSQKPSGSYRIRISSHDESSRVLQLVCEPCRGELDTIFVNLDYTDRLVCVCGLWLVVDQTKLPRNVPLSVDGLHVVRQSLFCDDEAYENLSAAASKFCYEGRPRTMDEVLTFLSTKLAIVSSSGSGSGTAVRSGQRSVDLLTFCMF
jgi:hypothetical protein